jgi:hypothetical protein
MTLAGGNLRRYKFESFLTRLGLRPWVFPWTFSISDILSEKRGFQHARRSNPAGAIAASGFGPLEDIRGSDDQILAPMGRKNVRQLTYRQVSRRVDVGFAKSLTVFSRDIAYSQLSRIDHHLKPEAATLKV